MWTFLPFPLAYIHKRGIFDIDQSGLQSPSQFSEIRLSAIEPTPNARIPPSSSEAWTEGAGGMRSVKANTSPAKPLALRRFNLVFAASLGAIMLIVALAISPAENCVFAQLIPALRDIHLPVQTRISISDAGPFLKAFEFLLLSTLAAASIWIGKHRKLPELAIVSAQLYVEI